MQASCERAGKARTAVIPAHIGLGKSREMATGEGKLTRSSTKVHQQSQGNALFLR